MHASRHITTSCDYSATPSYKYKGKGPTLVIAPLCRHGPLQRRSGTWHAQSSVAHTCLIPSQPQPVLIYRPQKDGGLSKPRPRMQTATCPLLLRDRLRPAGLEPRSRDRQSSMLTTRLSCHPLSPYIIAYAKIMHACTHAYVCMHTCICMMYAYKNIVVQRATVHFQIITPTNLAQYQNISQRKWFQLAITVNGEIKTAIVHAMRHLTEYCSVKPQCSQQKYATLGLHPTAHIKHVTIDFLPH